MSESVRYDPAHARLVRIGVNHRSGGVGGPGAFYSHSETIMPVPSSAMLLLLGAGTVLKRRSR